VFGGKLKAGAFIKVWWKPGVDMITRIVPYKGNLEYVWEKYGEKARSANFVINRTGMIIEPQTVIRSPLS